MRDASRVPAVCLGVFLVVWLALAIAPMDRSDWLLENLPVFAALPLVLVLHRRAPLSDRAYVQLTIFLLLHAVGSHYTYSKVPIGGWVGDALGLGRNHYDRVVHFAFGVLMFLPISELAFRSFRGGSPLARLYLGVAAVAVWSATYEIVEWLVASVADPEAGIAYLGTQGDVWDAQKDLALACVGAVLAGLHDCRRQHDRSPSAPPERRRAARGDGKAVTLISGGQTGVDRACLAFAIRHGVPHGGWCPRGRRSADGPIDPRYQLRETPSGDYAQRTEWNVRDSDVTVVISGSADVAGGTLLTIESARVQGKPLVHVTQTDGVEAAAARVVEVVRRVDARTVNVAGPRRSESDDPEGLARFVSAVLSAALAELRPAPDRRW